MNALNWIADHWTAVIIAIAGLVIVVASLKSAVDQDSQTKAMAGLQAKNTELTEATNALVVTNTDLTKENQRLTVELSNRFTGGDSFVYLSTAEVSGAPITYGLYFTGEYDLHNLRMVIKNQDKASLLTSGMADKAQIEGLSAAVKSVHSSIVYDDTHSHYPNTGEGLMPLPTLDKLPPLLPGKTATYSYNTTASNFKTNGFLFLYRDDAGTLHTAEMVKRGDDVIHEVPENYPKIANPQPAFLPIPDWSRF